MNLESVRKMHTILRPFMLRRTKKDLATKLPDKIEIQVKVHLT
jgi:SNF2 family DNA or RNA helicase